MILSVFTSVPSLSDADIRVVPENCDVFAFEPIRNFRKDTRHAYVILSNNVSVALSLESIAGTPYGTVRNNLRQLLAVWGAHPFRHQIFIEERKKKASNEKKNPKSFLTYFL